MDDMIWYANDGSLETEKKTLVTKDGLMYEGMYVCIVTSLPHMHGCPPSTVYRPRVRGLYADSCFFTVLCASSFLT